MLLPHQYFAMVEGFSPRVTTVIFVTVVILYAILSKTARGLEVLGGASANRPKGRLLGWGWIKAALGKSPFMLG